MPPPAAPRVEPLADAPAPPPLPAKPTPAKPTVEREDAEVLASTVPRPRSFGAGAVGAPPASAEGETSEAPPPARAEPRGATADADAAPATPAKPEEAPPVRATPEEPVRAAPARAENEAVAPAPAARSAAPRAAPRSAPAPRPPAAGPVERPRAEPARAQPPAPPEAVVVEFLNPFCMHCRATEARLDRVGASLPVKVRRVRVPIWSQDPPPLWAQAWTVAAETGLEDRFFTELMREPRETPQATWNALRRAGIDPGPASAQMSRGVGRARLDALRARVFAARITRLPTLDVGRRRLQGEPTEAELREAILLAAAAPAASRP
jgi:hypothetical protein